ncbi:DUF5723 family protein [Flavobacterium granuli]|uniref:DUF5723 domain-containing protein n=1 Tax=Flavobacterium granuli TaxID=280093 RepID=A0A1M5LD55_9FLAO|nr:DUF5723 family protein [Flavobacterium granuli]PRZ23931.1 hypothetical protein BC624_10440 [Flavobacterium granuli]SHG62629.1 hypothetical protein SAMN05443373_10340 [Flavobacterium granuli]
MRKTYLFLLLLVSISCLAQNKQVLYNFTSVPQSLLVNPGADFKYQYYFGVPMLSGVSANMGSTGFSAYDLFANNGVDFNTKLRDVVFSTTRKDHLALNEQLEIFNGGFKLGDWFENKGYISFGMYQEFDFWSYMPKDLAILALDGNKDYIGKVFNLGDLSVKSEVVSVLHVGYHKNVSEKLILGARAKIYSSAFNATSTKNSGYIYTIPGTTTAYEQLIYSRLRLNTSGIAQFTAEDYDGDIARDIRKKALFGGDLGLGFDVGFTYYPQKNMQLTASIIDVGFIKHSKNVENYTYEGFYKYEGMNPNFSTGGSVENVYDEFKNAIPLDTLYTKYTTWRPTKLNASYQYSFGTRRDEDCVCTGQDKEYKNAVGAQLFMMSTPRTPITALTAYYRRSVFNKMQMKATYTLDSYSSKNIGLGLSADLGKFNMYFMADNLLEYKDLSKANSLSFQFGFNFIFKDSNEPY